MNIGGQAVIEGVMMRSPHCWTVAVRRPDSTIALYEKPWKSWSEKARFLKWPFFRGGVVLAESLSHGFKALMISSREAYPEEAEEMKKSGSSTTLALILGIAAAIALFKFLPHFAALGIGWLFGVEFGMDDAAFHILDGVIKMGVFVTYVTVIGRMEEIRRLYMYHGAEHKAIYGFEKAGTISLDTALVSGRLHPRCGTAFLAVVILTSIIVYSIALPFVPPFTQYNILNQVILVFVKVLFLFPIGGFAYEFNRFAGNHSDSAMLRPFIWPGLAIQKITTSEPSSDQVEVALVALGACLRMEQNLESQKTDLQDEDAAEDAATVVFPDFDTAKTQLLKDIRTQTPSPACN